MAQKKIIGAVATPEVIGIDVGFGFTKVFPGNIVFPSVIAEYRERMTSFGNHDPLKNLIVDIEGEKENGTFLVGELAKKENGTATFDKDDHQRHRICMLTGIVLTVGGDYTGPVVMGLPVSDFQRKRKDIASLKGEYTVTLQGQKYNINITEVLVTYQGAASFYDLILDEEGKLIVNIAGKKTGLIDIGEKTLDFVALSEMDFIMSKSGGLDLGMHKAYLRLLAPIQNELDITCMPYQVKDYLPRIPKFQDHEYGLLADEIYKAISQWWNFHDFDKIYLTGGGGVALFPYFAEKIKKCEVIDNAQLSNARGYYKCGRTQK